MESPLTKALEERGVLVLDGAMATELERHGADLSGPLWSARVLLDAPELVTRVHRDNLAAGADVISTASYQASVAGFVAAGLTPSRAREAMLRCVRLAVAARDTFWAGAAQDSGRARPLVATSVGPYGAVLADGSEYRGDYAISRRDLLAFHRERLAVLVAEGADVLACETIPSLVEAEALVEALAGWPELTAWVSFSARNDHETSDGTAVADCAALLQDADQVVAVGVNCTALGHTTSLVRHITEATDKPVVVYPNSGEVWDPDARVWRGDRSSGRFGSSAQEWYAAGARLVGGCCRTGPADVAAVAQAATASRRGQ